MSRVAATPWRLSANFLPILAIFLVTGVGLFTGWLFAPVAVFAFVAAGWIISLCLHESAHAFAAYKGGDQSVVEKGYLSLDPLAYAHPLMTFGFPMLFLLLGGIGLPGGAVYINRTVLKSKHWDAFVALAGPLANLVVLVVLSLPFLLGLQTIMGNAIFWGAVAFLAALQASAALINLLPVPGLDGFGIIRPYLPYDLQAKALQLAPLISMGLLFLLMSGSFGGKIWNVVFGITTALGINPQFILYGDALFRFWQ